MQDISSKVHPAITIVTPTYNRAPFLRQTIESVLSQDFSNFEYLIIDDGSTDNTAEVVKSYLQDARVSYLYHDNQGESATVNRGWECAKGNLVVVVNSDDSVKEGFLRTLVQFMEGHPTVIVGYPDWDMIDEAGGVIKKVVVPEYNRDEMIISYRCYPGPGTVIRKSALSQIEQFRDKQYVYFSDLATWWNLSFYGHFARIPHNVANWRSHRGTTTTVLPLNAVAEIDLLVKNFLDRKDAPLGILHRKKELQKNAEIAQICIQFNFYTREGHFLKSRWIILRFLFKYPDFSTSSIKLLIRFFLGNKGYQFIKECLRG